MLSHPNNTAKTDAVLLKISPCLVRDVVSVASGFVSPIHQLEGSRIGCSAYMPLLSLFYFKPLNPVPVHARWSLQSHSNNVKKPGGALDLFVVD